MLSTRNTESSVSSWISGILSDDCQLRYFSTAVAGTVACVTILIIFFNGGIYIGSNNHVGILPVVRRILDSNYLPGDFGINLRLYHHREFAYVIAGLTRVAGEDGALITLSIVSTLALGVGLFCLCCGLRISLAGYFVAGLFLALSVAWTGRGLEMNTLVGDSEINPTTLAHACVLFSVAAALAGRYSLAAFFAGLTLFFHLQVGVILLVLLAPLYAVQLRRWRVKAVIYMAVLYLIPASFPLWYLWQMSRRGVFGSSFSLDYIHLRMPQHFELGSVGSALWIAAHLLVQFASYSWLRKTKSTESHRVGALLMISLLLTILSLAHFADYYLLKSITIVKLQFIRLSSLITLFGTLAFISMFHVWMEERGHKGTGLPAVLFYIGLSLAAGGQFLYAMTTGRPDFSLAVRRYVDQRSPWVEICRWIDTHGPRDTVYLTPPGNEGFAYLANRSPVVEFKINPDGAQYLSEWYDRLTDLAGGSLPKMRRFDYDGLLNQAFSSLRPTQLVALGAKYHTGYAVVPKSSKVPFEVIYGNSGYRLVKLPGHA